MSLRQTWQAIQESRSIDLKTKVSILIGIMRTQRTRFKTSSFGIVNDKVTNVGVSAKDLNGRIRANLANGIDHGAEGAAADSRTRRVVAEDDKHVDWL